MKFVSKYLFILLATLLFGTNNSEAVSQGNDFISKLNNTFISVNEKAQPTTVNIRVHVRNWNKRLDYWKEYWKRFGEDIDIEKYKSRGAIASGVFLSEDGFIITNQHVVDETDIDSIVITVNDGDKYYADLVGFDKQTDLAVLKIYGKDFSEISFANSEDVRVGQWVVAIGSPLGLSKTLTSGIISAIERGSDDIKSIGEDDLVLKSYLQTDAAINPGNSGGGLFDLNGFLIGINTANYTRTGFGMGYGFAIPSNIVNKVTEDLIDDGEVSRGYLGIDFDDVDEKIKETKGLTTKTGIIVTDIGEGTPADSSDLKVDDVITHVDGNLIEHTDDLVKEMFEKGPEIKVIYTVEREGAEMEVEVTLGRSEPEVIDGSYFEKVAALNLVLKDDDSACIIEEVMPYGTAAKAELQIDDIFESFDGTKITTPKSLSEKLETKKPGDWVKIIIDRNGEKITKEIVLHTNRN